MKWIKNLFKKDVIEVINDQDLIMNVWISNDLTIAFLKDTFHAQGEKLYFGGYDLWRGLIRWKYSGEINHEIFKQNVNYQFKGNKLLITWDDKSFEFHKKGK